MEKQIKKLVFTLVKLGIDFTDIEVEETEPKTTE
jgi:hypothetical protein